MNTIVNPTWVMKDTARLLVNELVFSKNVNRGYDSAYKVQGAKVGDLVKGRLPQRYRVSKGQAMTPVPVENRTFNIEITDQAHIGIEFSAASLTLEVDEYRKNYIMPAVEALVNQVDYDGLSRMYKEVPRTVGTPGVTPGTTGTLPQAANSVYQTAVTKLRETAVPGPYTAVISPDMEQYLVSASQAIFNPARFISESFVTGQFSGAALGIKKWLVDNNVTAHTVGALGGTPLVNGASQTGTSLVTDGWTAAAATRLKKGDVIQIAGVKDINPMSYQSVRRLSDQVVTADTASDGSGNMTIPIWPGITPTGNYATVSASPADDAAITIFGHASSYASVETAQGLIYHEDAFALVFADLEKPEGLWVSERISNKALGISVRFLKDHDIMSDQAPARVDLLYGWNATRREMACRVAA